MKYIKLSNGYLMPIIGLGTYTIKGKFVNDVIANSYNMGYRMYDTAWKYQNEKEIGKAIKRNQINRSELFITTKLNYLQLRNWHLSRFWRKSINVSDALNNSLKSLNTSYIDLYLMHWPYSNRIELWKDMIELYKQGFTKAIGVCSFSIEQLEEIKKHTNFVPHVNQIELHPLYNRRDLVEYCKKNNIQVEAFSSFAHGEATKELMENETLRTIAIKYEKSVPQVILRWIIQQDIIVIPRTIKNNKLEQNIDIFDFELSELDMKIIDGLNENKSYGVRSKKD